MADKIGKELDYNLGAVLVTWEDQGDSTFAKRLSVRGAVWDPIGLSWVREQQALLKTDTLTVSADVSDRSARLLGHVTVDTLPAVTGTVTSNAGTNLNTSLLALDSTLTGRTQKAQITDGTRDGTVKAASTLPVATDTAFVVTQRDTVTANATLAAETTKVIGTVNVAAGQAITANAGTNLNTSLLATETTLAGRLKPADTLTAVTTVATVTAVTAITNALPAGTNRIGSVRPVDSADADLTQVKGTQTARAIGVQDFKDSGRVNILWTAEFAATAATEALLTLTESRDGGATSTFTSKVVTSGKRLRITSITMALESGGSTGTALQRGILRLRFNTAGAVTTSSPLQGVWEVGFPTAPALKGVTTPITEEFPDGIEYLGDGTKQIGFSLITPDWVTTTMIPTTRVTVFAYEY